MFEPSLHQPAPAAVIERRAINLEAWHSEVAALTGQHAEVRLALGRKFRELFAAVGRAEALKEIEKHGHDVFLVARLIQLANKADGVVVQTKQRAAAFTKKDLKEMLAALKAGEVDAVIAALEEVV